MAKYTVPVPDIGGAENVDVIEVAVSVGDTLAADDPIVTLESDKASMDIPSPKAGKVIEVLIAVGDQVSEGSDLVVLEEGAEDAPSEEPSSSEQSGAAESAAPSPAAEKPSGAVSSQEITVTIPDIGGAENVDVIEICVAKGDAISEGDSILVLESDKASMEVPSSHSGTVVDVLISEGAKVSEGDAVLTLQTGASSSTEAVAPSADTKSSQHVSTAAEPAPAAQEAQGGGKQDVAVPDIGGAEDVDVIEVSVTVGDTLAEGDTMIVLESDKASMDVPAPSAGKVLAVHVKEGDKVSEGSAILVLEAAGSTQASAAPQAPAKTQAAPQVSAPTKSDDNKPRSTHERLPQEIKSSGSDVYAGPAVRKLARQLGVDLAQVKAAGPKGRISKDDVKAHVKTRMQQPQDAGSGAAVGSGIPHIPEVDFTKFGDVEVVKMSKIHKLTAANMTRNWLNIPHVTQFDDADVTDLEEFRGSMKGETEKKGFKLTPLPFLLKACAMALKNEPSFNVSLHADGEHVVKKKYIHIGVAVATPAGLVVPVVKDVDKKGLFQLAEETSALAAKARDGKLLPKEMQGGCFTISSLGAIGGTGFTPIINAPEVAILGVSKASMQPVWDGKAFVPRQMLPLSLSYDHRAINGADAGRFFTYLTTLLADVRRLSL